ncbi:hypothetical protein Anas_05087 [Armadillidium nasatum]|uniref:CHK kinase-like domain-containing protein n=1 Tax=Armadillidium nasatum TaxID=96803 RepID=A0A5N5SYH1_9CRUS|nr:hypothetical protein Anas_05087 [Armadillidium nasatum]
MSGHNSYELITEELLKESLQNDKGKKAKLLSWSIKDFTNKGDGYTSFVTSVTIKYMDAKILSEVSYVLKLNPQRPISEMTDLAKDIFSREKVILTDVLGAMSKHLERLNLAPIKTPILFASYLEQEKEALVLENLRTQGFQMHERRIGHDYQHAFLVMEELGRFHASSLLLEEAIAPKTFMEAFEYFEEPWFDVNNKTFKVFEKLITSHAEGAIKFLNVIPLYEKCVKWLNSHMQNLGRYFLEGFKSNKPFEVLAHGDCWTNNMLFKYNSKNTPVDVRFLDLQASRIASPAVDLNFYLYSSLTGKARSKYFQEYLYLYYESFSKVLRLAQREVPFPFKDLEIEVEKRRILGLIIGIIALASIINLEDDDIVSCDETTEDVEQFEEKRKKKFEKMSKKEEFKDRYLSIFDEMIQSNIFDEI